MVYWDGDGLDKWSSLLDPVSDAGDIGERGGDIVCEHGLMNVWVIVG